MDISSESSSDLWSLDPTWQSKNLKAFQALFVGLLFIPKVFCCFRCHCYCRAYGLHYLCRSLFLLGGNALALSHVMHCFPVKSDFELIACYVMAAVSEGVGVK